MFHPRNPSKRRSLMVSEPGAGDTGQFLPNSPADHLEQEIIWCEDKIGLLLLELKRELRERANKNNVDKVLFSVS